MKYFQRYAIFVLFFLLASSCTQKSEEPKGIFENSKKELDRVVDQAAKIGEKEAKSIESLIAEFKAEKDDLKRFMLCQKINLGNMSLSLKSLQDGSPAVESSHKKDIEMTSEFCREMISKVTRFEESLTTADWESIAEGLKDSYLVKTRTFAAKPKECTESDIQSVIDTGESAFQKTTSIGDLMILIGSREQLNFDIYLPKYRAVVEAKKHPDKLFILKYLDYIGELHLKHENKKRERQMIADRARKLLKTGVSDLKAATHKALSIAPHCFARLSMSGVRNSQIVFNKRQMLKLRDFLAKSENAVEVYLEPAYKMEGWLEFRYKKRDEIKKMGLEMRDVYGRNYLFKSLGNRIQILSLGRDRRINTEDDLMF